MRLGLGASGQQVRNPLLPEAALHTALLQALKHACQQMLLRAQPPLVSLHVQARQT